MKFTDITKVFTLALMAICCVYAKGEELNEKNYFNRLTNKGENIWIATSKGVIKYNKTEGEAYNANKVLGVENDDVVNCIKSDRGGKIWFSVEGKGIFCYDEEKITKRNDLYIESLLRLSFAFNSNDSIWISAGGYYVSPFIDDRQIGYTTPDNYSMDKKAYIMDMEFDSKGNLWISIFGEYNSLLCHKANNSYCESIIAKGNTVIPSLTIDSNDNIWYSTRRDIICHNTTTNSETRYWNDTDNNIPAAHFFGSDIDDEGNIWFTSSHYLLRYDGENFKWWNCYGYHEACAILCDGECVWILMRNDELFKFEDEKFEIIDLSPAVTGIEESTAKESDTKAYVSNGMLYIENAEGINTVEIYDVTGKKITSGTYNNASVQISLPSILKGVIIVKVDSEIIKVTI